MADTYNYRRGETNPAQCKIATIQAVSLGDAVRVSSGWVLPAANEAYTTLSTAQYDFATNFMGVAAQRKAASTAYVGAGGGPANRIRIDTDGVFEFDTAATTYDVGDLVGMEKASGSALESQKVAPVSDRARAIGSVEEPKTVAAMTKVKVRIFSSKMYAPVDKN